MSEVFSFHSHCLPLILVHRVFRLLLFQRIAYDPHLLTFQILLFLLSYLRPLGAPAHAFAFCTASLISHLVSSHLLFIYSTRMIVLHDESLVNSYSLFSLSEVVVFDPAAATHEIDLVLYLT